MPTYVYGPSANLGSSKYGGATDLEIKVGAQISGGGYAADGITGLSAIFSLTPGITLSSVPGSTIGQTPQGYVTSNTHIQANNGADQTATSAAGNGGIGVELETSDSFFNSDAVRGGHGGNSLTFLVPGGNGGAGVALSGGAYLNNAGGVTGGTGGGYTLPGTTLTLLTGTSAVGVEVAGGTVVNSGIILGGGSVTNQVAGSAGVQMDAGSTANYLDNGITGTITGGIGNSGGAGVNLVSYNQTPPLQSNGSAAHGTIYNQGTITGGASEGGVGGDGVDVAASQGFGPHVYDTDLDNVGTIGGGAGTTSGGIGVNLGAADIGFNSGTIQGGNGANGSNGNGGTGLAITGGTFFYSSGGTLQGGAGAGTGSGGAGAYIGGYGTTLQLSDTTVVSGVSGTPGGTMADAVQFSQYGFADVAITATDTIDGQVAGSYQADDDLTLNGSGATGAASIDFGAGTQFTGFSSLAFGTDASWNVDTTTVGLTHLTGQGGIIGMTSGDVIDVTDLASNPAKQSTFTNVHTYTNPSNPTEITEFGTLTIYGTNQQYSVYLSGLSVGATVQAISDGSSGTDIVVIPAAACFLRGTRIRTERGEVPIETLSISDRVLCNSGETRPVRWVGHRSIDCSRYEDPSSVWPVCIRAGALAEQQPARDLWVSPGHAVMVNGVLIQAEKLVNGVTVVRMPRERVDYWHVELDAHDVLISEGLATESYLDTGNRSAFFNGGAFLQAYPDFRSKHWSETCVPLVTEGPELTAARARVLGRAQELGYAITHDADVHVIADGERLDPICLGDKRLAFVVPANRKSIELRSRTFVPAHVEAASGDGRELGLCVGRLQVDGTDWVLSDDQHCGEGWHGLETFADGHTQRWTTGRTPLAAGTRLIVIDTAGRSYCWQQPEQGVALCG